VLQVWLYSGRRAVEVQTLECEGGGEAVSINKKKPWVFLALYIAYAVAVFLGWLALEKVFPVQP
jgi:hypothetical protein